MYYNQYHFVSRIWNYRGTGEGHFSVLGCYWIGYSDNYCYCSYYYHGYYTFWNDVNVWRFIKLILFNWLWWNCLINYWKKTFLSCETCVLSKCLSLNNKLYLKNCIRAHWRYVGGHMIWRHGGVPLTYTSPTFILR